MTVPAADPSELDGELLYNHDDGFEGGFCWQFAGSAPPYYGCFGEAFDLGPGMVEAGAFWLTQIGYFAGGSMDCYIWQGGVTKDPSAVLCVLPGIVPESIPFWPSCERSDVEIDCWVDGEFTIGWWADNSDQACQWYACADYNGSGGDPWTCIAPGIGYPTGWEDPSIVWGTTNSMGIGVWWSEGCLVHPDGSGDYPTIQAALDAVADETYITLARGTYQGEGNRDVDFRGKSVTVRSRSGNPENTIIDCEGSAADPHRGFLFHAGEDSSSVLRGIQIVNGHAPGPDRRGGGIRCAQSSPAIIGCLLAGNSAAYGGGLSCFMSSPRIDHCTIIHNHAEHGAAIDCELASPVIRNCTLSGNQAGLGMGAAGGIECWDYSTPEIYGTIIAFSVEGQAMQCWSSSTAELSCCDLYGNEGGDWVGPIGDQLFVRQNRMLDPCFCDMALGDYHLWNYSPCHQEGCGIIGAWPVGCWETQEIAEEREGRAARGSHGGLSVSVTPNPLTRGTTISWSAPAGGAIATAVIIHDAAGRRVRTLRPVVATASRTGSAIWDGRLTDGSPAASGAYWYRVMADEREPAAGRVLVVR
ncbi:MAG: hypothetical protein GF330_13990 [Candidatus Eisenbacteria bacterium]|nr:hypothetical protein [Candidatus Eisenbacteria bacterium]